MISQTFPPKPSQSKKEPPQEVKSADIPGMWLALRAPTHLSSLAWRSGMYCKRLQRQQTGWRCSHQTHGKLWSEYVNSMDSSISSSSMSKSENNLNKQQ